MNGNGTLTSPDSTEPLSDHVELTSESGEVIGTLSTLKADGSPFDDTLREWKHDISAKWVEAENAGVSAGADRFKNTMGEYYFTNPTTGEEALKIENYDSAGYILQPQTNGEQERQIQVIVGKPGVAHWELSRALTDTDLFNEDVTYLNCRVGTAKFTDGTTTKFAKCWSVPTQNGQQTNNSS